MWSFNVKFNTTDQNLKTFEEFKLFCKRETDNNYLQGIKTLIELHSKDFKYNALYDLIELLQIDVNNLRNELEQYKKENSNKEEKPMFKTFGE